MKKIFLTKMKNLTLFATSNELKLSQQRVAETLKQIHTIEMKGMKESEVIRKKKEFQFQEQQSNIRQQKEAEFLREIQFLKSRQLAAINDFEITCSEELEEITSQQKAEEFEVTMKQNLLEAELTSALEKEKTQFMTRQLLARQVEQNTTFLRNQKKQAKLLAKAQRNSRKARVKASILLPMLLFENPVIDGSQDTGGAEFEASESGSEADSQADSEAAGEVQAGSVVSLTEDEIIQAQQRSEAEKNKALNKNTQVMTESEKEFESLLDSGTSRRTDLLKHHKRVIQELRQNHRAVLKHKMKEHRRKMQDLLKDHEDEMEQLKVEQMQLLKELMDMQAQSVGEEISAEQTLISAHIPVHVLESLHENPDVLFAESFKTISILHTDISGFSSLLKELGPADIFALSNKIQTRFDHIISKYNNLYTIASSDRSYIIAAGLGHETAEENWEEITKSAIQLLRCAQELISAASNEKIKLKVGVHSGAVKAGLIGGRQTKYAVFGDTVEFSAYICRKAEPGAIHVSAHTISCLGNDDNFEFFEAVTVELKGKERLKTYSLQKH
ncbi:Nitrogen permease regulator 2 [Physocladia obscura]|uniref:Nitrogen permease regulator 2 n=1 Tax=Physocladia obscura TaxID=109957 RepID=A0AAD5SY66_9FUNG|nr:Nitrogen permease regulator 2 [Physocladia obscura]